MKLGLVLLALVCVYIVWARRRKAVLAVTITIAPSGESVVVFSTDRPSPDQLIRLMLCYGSKVRWLLNSEPTKLTEIFREFLAEVIGVFSSVDVNDLVTDVPLLREVAQNAQGAPASVPGGERFAVRVFYGAHGRAWITNDLPRPGLAFNIPWHYLILVQAIRSRLEQDDRHWAQRALQAWFVKAFTEQESTQSLNVLNATANDVTDRAQNLA